MFVELEPVDLALDVDGSSSPHVGGKIPVLRVNKRNVEWIN